MVRHEVAVQLRQCNLGGVYPIDFTLCAHARSGVKVAGKQ